MYSMDRMLFRKLTAILLVMCHICNCSVVVAEAVVQALK